MESRQPKRIRRAIFFACALLILLSFGCFHWGYFFPLETHTDLLFQVTGEIVALGIYLLSFTSVLFITGSSEARPRFHAMPALFRAVVAGFPWSTGMIAMNWRQNFSGQEFHPLWLLGNILIWYVGGSLFGFGITRAIDNNQEDEEQAA